MTPLRIYDRRERRLVAAADALLAPLSIARRLRRSAPARPARVICFRLERIGDLLMTLPALAVLRAALPGAEIDLVVGGWNHELAMAIPGVNRVEAVDAAWLARHRSGHGPLALARRMRRLRDRRYDLAINFEPDIRSNFAMAAAGARRTAGFGSGGGAAFLDVALDYDTTQHTADNALRLVRRTLGIEDGPVPAVSIDVPEAIRREATRLLQPLGPGLKIGVHVSGGRPIKQWPEERFHDVAARLIEDRGASIVFTGSLGDSEQIAGVRRGLPIDRILDLTDDPHDRFRSTASLDLVTVAAILQQLDVFVTGDTGPMHLAHAVGTPVVAIFGPSDPARYAPRGLRDRVVRIDLPCSPCNRIRLPPKRCVGHTPDCLAGVQTTAVLAAIDDALDRGRV